MSNAEHNKNRSASLIEDDEEIEYVTRDDVNMAILRSMEKFVFRERLRRIMPLVAKELVRAGVDFSKVDFSKVVDATDEEIDAIFEAL